jgi:flagellar basal-body M-ring protein/flagellar hook-basal body protein (fliF)
MPDGTPAADSIDGTRRPLQRFAFIAIGVVLVLTILWWAVLRTTWEPILTNIDPVDAADAVKVLDAKKIAYHLGDEGRTVLVASDVVDQARVELVGSELPMRGQVGFELFNQSDMGLTEFAQKINYQRALQGELARTILTLDGISSVRVHLGLPDRSVFRGEQSAPRASVTLMPRPGHSLTEATVQGVQRLVSGAIPDMSPDAVSVLDGEGRVVSNAAMAVAPASTSDAVVQNWQRVIVDAIQSAHPDLKFIAQVSLRYRPQSGATDSNGAEGKDQTLLPNDVTSRGVPDYALAVRITTPTPLNDDMRGELGRIVQSATDARSARGDSVVFLTGPLNVTPTAETNASNRVVYTATPSAVPANEGWGPYAWPVGIVIGTMLLAAAWWTDRRRSKLRKSEEFDSFARTLRERLSLVETRQ